MNGPTCAREFRDFCRARIRELGITYETVDEIAGFGVRGTTKYLAEPPLRKMSIDAMFQLLGAIALVQDLKPDDNRLKRLRNFNNWQQAKRVGPQYAAGMRPVAKHRAIKYATTVARMRFLGVLGNAARKKKLNPQRRRKIAKHAAKVRWADVKAAAQSSTAIALPKSRESASRRHSAGTDAAIGQGRPHTYLTPPWRGPPAKSGV